MGIYLNPGKEMFQESILSKIYVDKTGLIAEMNDILGTEEKFVCVSRPRRFGKSMAAKMLVAYYSRECDSRELFSELNISKNPSFEKYLNQFDVLFFNMQRFLSRAGDAKEMLPYLQMAVLKELRLTYGEDIDETETKLVTALEHIYNRTKKGFVFIIDEWDSIFREKQTDIEVQTAYLDFLRDLLKDQPYVKLAYMTGILPIKKYGTHSALNMFDEFSMTDQKWLAEYTGFTEKEVQKLCDEYGMDFSETKRWYDGYRFRRAPHVYNPKSVVTAMRGAEFSSYWTQTETYEALKVYIEMNFDGLKDDIILMLNGGRCRINTGTFSNDMVTFQTKDDVLTLLIHLGYLAYDIDAKEVYVPNEEVRGEFVNAITASGWQEVISAFQASEQLLKATLAGNTEAVAKGLDLVHTEAASVLTYNNENS